MGQLASGNAMICRPAQLWAISLCLFSVLVAAQGISPTAKICNVPPNIDPTIKDNVNYLLVSNQTDLDAAFAGCTTINGDILISSTYTGGFNLSELIAINGSIQTVDQPATNGTRGLTFIALDNLQTLNTMFEIENAPNLTSISMASATYVQNIAVLLWAGASLNFPELLNLTSLQIYGYFGSINFTRLNYIELGMAVGYGWINSPVETYSDPSRWGQDPPIEINFPSLTYSACVNIWGNISSLSFPVLETINVLETVNGEQVFVESIAEGLYVGTAGNQLDVAFPKLSNCSTVAIYGTIGGLGFDSLLTVDRITISPYFPMGISLDHLENATYITLKGNVTFVDLSSMKYIGQSLYIASDDSYLNCSDAQQNWNKTSHNPSVSSVPSWDTSDGFYCESPTSPWVPPAYIVPITSNTKNPLSESAKAAIVVGTVLPTIIILIWWVNRREKKRQANKHPPAYEIELHNRHEVVGGEGADGEVLPAYEPPPEAERPVSPVSSVRTENAVGEERPPSPPGYEHATREEGGVSGGGVEEGATRDTENVGH